jgi:methyl-accepting chemotaxis protein
MKNTAKLLALLIVLGLAGCATTKDLESVRTLAEQANATADMALKTANEANATAQEAKAIAQEANATAQNANATAATTEDKIDRMFKKAMYK